MKSSLLTLAALGASSALALPASHLRNSAASSPDRRSHSSTRSLGESSSFSIPLHSVTRRSFDSPGQAKASFLGEVDRLLIKYGKLTPPQKSRLAELQRRQTIGLTNVNGDSQYFGQISVGTPSQHFLVAIDTGSADTWLMDSSCGVACHGRPTFNPSASSSYQGGDTPFEIIYGTGSAKGTLAADRVSFAGYEVLSQTFAVIDEVLPGAALAPASGILGLGFEAHTATGATPFWEVLARSGKLPEPVFTVQLSRQKDNPKVVKAVTADHTLESLTPGGVMTFGAIDHQQYSGAITYTNVVGADKWAIPLDSLTFNGKVIDVKDADKKAIVDTGTGLIAGPPAIIKAVYDQIPGSRIAIAAPDSLFTYYIMPCDSEVGSISFSFGGKDWPMSATDLPFAETGEPGEEGLCYGSLFASTLVEHDANNPAWILGISFLKNVFQVYDADVGKGPARIGFAALKGPTAQTVSTTEGAVKYQSQQNAFSSRSTRSSTSTAAQLQLPTQSNMPTPSASMPDMIGGWGLPDPTPGIFVPATPSIEAGIVYDKFGSTAISAVLAEASAVPSQRSSGSVVRGSSHILAAVCIVATFLLSR